MFQPSQFARASMICFQSEESNGQLASKEILVHITPQTVLNEHCLKVTKLSVKFGMENVMNELLTPSPSCRHWQKSPRL